MKLHCPACGQDIPASDINLQTLTAKCAACNNVFSFSQAVKEEGLIRRPMVAQSNGIVPTPSRFIITDFAGQWTVTYRWFTPAILFLTFFCVAWDSFLVFWYSMAIRQQHVPWLMVVFPVAHVAVGIGLTYSVLTGFLNRTKIALANHRLSIVSGPLPSRGNLDLSSSDIRQVYCEMNLRPNTSSPQNGPQVFLSAVMKDGRKQKLIGNLRHRDEARYLQQQIEKRLGIVHERVDGEMT